MNSLKSVCIAGAGTMGTALGQILSEKPGLEVTLLSVEEPVVNDINQNHYNSAYFPQIRLHPKLSATTNPEVLLRADIVFLALPSVVVVDYLANLKRWLNPEAILVNLSKGFGKQSLTIAENLDKEFSNPICALKGPTFARELINQLPTAMTIGCTDSYATARIEDLFKSTVIATDSTTDIKGVELLSILKNIYAIIIGIVDAQFSSPNLRFLVFTKAFNEMRNILTISGGQEETIFRYCGIGDFGLTALNDLSRNRTLGLLIGKGFFDNHISDKVVLEGKIATGVFVERLREEKIPTNKYLIINELYRFFQEHNRISSFVNKILS